MYRLVCGVRITAEQLDFLLLGVGSAFEDMSANHVGWPDSSRALGQPQLGDAYETASFILLLSDP